LPGKIRLQNDLLVCQVGRGTLLTNHVQTQETSMSSMHQA